MYSYISQHALMTVKFGVDDLLSVAHVIDMSIQGHVWILLIGLVKTGSC